MNKTICDICGKDIRPLSGWALMPMGTSVLLNIAGPSRHMCDDCFKRLVLRKEDKSVQERGSD